MNGSHQFPNRNYERAFSMSKQYDLFELEKMYSSEIEKARLFLANKGSTSKGSKISGSRVDYMISRGAQCPLCGNNFMGANHNTEHIHPRGLGGENKPNNKIQICLACNNARNQVMLGILEHPPFRRSYPENWNNVKRFLIWSISSIDLGTQAASQIPEIQQLFLTYRSAGGTLKSPQIAFHRISTWKIGDDPNSPLNKEVATPSSETKNIPPSKGLFITFFDYVFGYGREEKIKRLNAKKKLARQASQRKKKSTMVEPEFSADSIENSSDNIEVAKKMNVRVMPGETINFEKMMRIFLQDGEAMSLNSVGHAISRWQKQEGWPELGTKVFLERCGLNRNGGLMKTIQSRMSDEVTITGDEPPFKIQYVATPTEIKLLNSRNSGFRLPFLPTEVAAALIWFTANQDTMTTTKEVREGLRNSDTIKSRTRASSFAGKIGYIVIKDQDVPFMQVDWTKALRLEPLQIAQQLRDYLLKTEVCNNEGEDFQNQLNLYFDRVEMSMCGKLGLNNSMEK